MTDLDDIRGRLGQSLAAIADLGDRLAAHAGDIARLRSAQRAPSEPCPAPAGVPTFLLGGRVRADDPVEQALIERLREGS